MGVAESFKVRSEMTTLKKLKKNESESSNLVDVSLNCHFRCHASQLLSALRIDNQAFSKTSSPIY